MEECKTLNYPDLYEQFKREKQYLRNVSPATLSGYGWAWKAFEPILKSAAPISKADLVTHVATLRMRRLSPVTVNTYARSLNTFFRWLSAEGHCEHLITVPRLKEDHKVIAAFTDVQVVSLISFRPTTPAERRIHTIACLILDTGARIDEVLSAGRADVDIDNLLLKICEGKGGKQRVVPVSVQMRKLLFRYMQGAKPGHGDLLFFTGEGDKISQRNALRDFKRICTRIRITGVRCSFHTLRHSFGKAYIRNGGDVFRLQRILGHSKLEMTRKYVNLETSDLQSCHQRFSLLATAGR